jgi:hypothetical protein
MKKFIGVTLMDIVGNFRDEEKSSKSVSPALMSCFFFIKAKNTPNNRLTKENDNKILETRYFNERTVESCVQLSGNRK